MNDFLYNKILAALVNASYATWCNATSDVAQRHVLDSTLSLLHVSDIKNKMQQTYGCVLTTQICTQLYSIDKHHILHENLHNPSD